MCRFFSHARQLLRTVVTATKTLPCPLFLKYYSKRITDIKIYRDYLITTLEAPLVPHVMGALVSASSSDPCQHLTGSNSISTLPYNMLCPPPYSPDIYLFGQAAEDRRNAARPCIIILAVLTSF